MRSSSVVQATVCAVLLGVQAIIPTGGHAAAGAGEQSPPQTPVVPRAVGVPGIMEPSSPFSAGVAATVAGPFHQISLLGDWDGREDLTVDHEGTVDDFSNKIPPNTQGFSLTRVAVSAHTIANGFNENVFYYGDSLGNVYVAQSPTLGGLPPGGLTGANIFSINLPTSLNAFGTLLSDSNIVITGLAVSPVTDLTSYANVNGAYAPYSGQIGEILYVTFWDTGGGLRLSSNNIVVRSGLLAFPVADIVSGAPAPPGIVSPVGFPVQVGGSFGVAFSVFSNIAGVAVDDDGNVYFQQVDLVGFTGGNIVKITDIGANQDRSLAVNGILTLTTLNPGNGNYGTTSGPVTQGNRFTNYSGTSTAFGNIAALATGQGNTLYAAVARSFDASDAAAQATMGPFAGPGGTGPTPSMVISFADAVGNAPGTPAGVVVRDGFADQATTGEPLVAGVNNFRVFVHGNGPEKRLATGSSPVFGTLSDTLKLDMQIDFGIYSGLVVDEEAKVYVVSGGSPNGFGSNPSPTRTEVLLFSDDEPTDRRGDYIDFRGNNPPNPPQSGGTIGDGDSDRFDHIFWQAPPDLTASPAGVAGLARGFLRYLNRTAPNAIPNLPNGTVQGDDATTGPIFFSDFDPGAQVAGGDDQNPPFRGDDSDGGGTPADPGVLRGGFEFAMAGTVVGVCTAPWNAFHLNSNGSVSFNNGDTSNIPLVGTFLSGVPKVAGAWADINPSSRVGALNTFPVQAVGFAGVNRFKVRWINTPEFGGEAAGSSNSFDISLFDDGTGLDENSNQPLNPANPIGNNAVPFDLLEGATDLRFFQPGGGLPLAGVSPRSNGTANFKLTYGRMDLLGTPTIPVLVGFSIGDQPPASVTEIDLSEVGRTTPLGNLTEKAIFEIFTENDFDLRFEGNDAALATPGGQPDLNRGTLDFVGTPCQITFPAVSGTKTVAGTFEVGGTITYTIVLTNNGTVGLTDAPLTAEFIDVLPPELTLVSANATAGTVTPDIPGNSVRWDGSLAPAASVTITIIADITGGTGGLPLANQGVILGPSVSDVTDDPSTPAADDPTLTPAVTGAPPTITITSPTSDPTFTATTLSVNLAGTATDDLGITSVTWSTDLGASGTATGTTNWTANIPLQTPGVTVITVTATDTSDVTATDVLTVTVNELLYYLAEGATGSFFDSDIAIANPNPVAAPIEVTFLRPGATSVVVLGLVGANSRHTIDVDSIPGVQDTAVSTVVSSTSAVPLLVERTMRWDDATQYGSHGEKAITEPSKKWFFGEGSQGFFDTFVLLANANPAPATVTVTFLTEFGPPVVQNVGVEPNSRFTLATSLVPELIDRSFSIVVDSDIPIIAERAMYFGTPLFNGGHESAGVTAPSTSWFLAEGATGPFFDMYVLIGNPNAGAVNVTLTYLLVGGGTVQTVKVIPANARLTVNVEEEDPLLAAAAVSVRVEATLPVVAERAMYWPGNSSTWYEAHNSFGLTETGTKWGLAEGQVGGPLVAETFILLANPTNTAAQVEITYLRTNGTTVVKNYNVGPTSRLNVYVNGEVPELANESFGAVVEVTNAVPIAVERAMYFSTGGVLFAAGTNVSAIPLP